MEDHDDDYIDDDGDDCDEDEPRKKQKTLVKKSKEPMRDSRDSITCGPNRATRPTNNQLLYKAHFRWDHDKLKIEDTSCLVTETQACASVTSCFLEVLATLHKAEQMRADGQPRNILLELSELTRKTKVVELSGGTHRVTDELRKHCLNDGVGGQYSTNLDRNRYGNDDNYLFTVIRYNLDFLGLCPCLVDIEIIDAKAEATGRGNQTIFDAGVRSCTCKDGTVNSSFNVRPNIAFSQTQKKTAGGSRQRPKSSLPKSSNVKGPSHLWDSMGGFRMPPPSPNASRSSLDALVLAAHQGMMGQMPDQGLVPPGLLMRSEFPLVIPNGSIAAPNVMSQSFKEIAPTLLPPVTGLGINNLMAAGLSAFTRLTPLNQKGVFGGLSPPEEQLCLFSGVGIGSSGGEAGLLVLGPTDGSSNGGGILDAGPRDQNPGPKGNASKLRRALSTGLFENLETGLELFRKSEMDDIASFPQPGSSDVNGGLNSLIGSFLPSCSGGSQPRLFKPIKRQVSASLLLCAESGGAGDAFGAFGAPSVENSGDDHEQGGGAVSKRAKAELKDHEDDTTGENEEGETEEDSSQRRRRHVSKQNSVANLSSRVSSAHVKRLTSEVEALRDENGSLLQRCLSAEQREQVLREQLCFLSNMMNQSNFAVGQILLAQQQQQAIEGQPTPGDNSLPAEHKP